MDDGDDDDVSNLTISSLFSPPLLSFLISLSHSSFLVDKGLLLLILGLGLERYCELCCAVLVL